MHVVLVSVCLLLVTPITMTSWWVAGSPEPYQICKKSSRRNRKMENMCSKKILMKQITIGYSQAQRECEYQFRYRRWNCTMKGSKKKVMSKDTRETAFVNAITAARVAYTVTKACKSDELKCTCDRNHKRTAVSPPHLTHVKYNRGGDQTGGGGNLPPPLATVGLIGRGTKRSPLDKGGDKYPADIPKPEVDMEWGGCGDNIHFGIRKSRDFMDTRFKRRSDIKTLVMLHNYAAGRLAIERYMRPECKCHGLSGSCTLKTCWLRMPPFREVGNRIKERFDGAVKVISGNDGHTFIPDGDTIKSPSAEDLVYTEESANFCVANGRVGSLGTVGRECNATSQGEDGCDILCCGRGYSVSRRVERVSCQCEFKWCCDVQCKTCDVTQIVNTCL